MVGAVESVTADSFLAAELVGQGVGGRRRGDGLMKGIVEHGDLLRPGEQLPEQLDALDVVGIMEGRQIGHGFDLFQHLVVDDHRSVEHPAAVGDPVPDGLEFPDVPDRPDLRIGHGRHHVLKGLFHVGDIAQGKGFLEFGGGDLMAGVGGADPLDGAFNYGIALRGVEDGVFQGGTAAVDDGDLHRFRGGGEVEIVGVGAGQQSGLANLLLLLIDAQLKDDFREIFCELQHRLRIFLHPPHKNGPGDPDEGAGPCRPVIESRQISGKDGQVSEDPPLFQLRQHFFRFTRVGKGHRNFPLQDDPGVVVGLPCFFDLGAGGESHQFRCLDAFIQIFVGKKSHEGDAFEKIFQSLGHTFSSSSEPSGVFI